ncbi:LOB domain-containing protein 36 [Magnolia sinica]|uniref:LOB domain-containing protein 36 n=1 Tax=Magnolia sinica TaxID=86752 RepID=UPI00265AC238|nr:LOB domain-containing protein 36 [Magnolia sinica]
MASSTNSPCAACKFLRRKCTHECVFAPYFPPDQPQKFANVHKVFGASNVAKLLNELAANQREDAVNSLAYEAEARLRDPVYGCVGLISLLQNKLRQVQLDLYNAKKELSVYVGPAAMMSIPHPAMMPSHPHQGGASSSMVPYGMSSMGAGLPPSGPSQAHLMMREQQHIMDSQQLAAAVREQELMRNYEHQQELARFNSGFDGGSGGAAVGFNQMSGRAGSPSPLALVPFDNSFQVQQEPEHQHPYQQQQRAGSDEGRNSVGPSS